MPVVEKIFIALLVQLLVFLSSLESSLGCGVVRAAGVESLVARFQFNFASRFNPRYSKKHLWTKSLPLKPHFQRRSPAPRAWTTSIGSASRISCATAHSP